MAFLVAAVVLVGALSLFTLVLTLAVLRRLREHTAELRRLAERPGFAPYDPAVLIGRTLPEPVAGARLVGFFDVSCGTCHERAPQFAATAAGQPAVAVVTGDGWQDDDLITILSGSAEVITGDAADRVAHLLDVSAFPTFLRVDHEGTIVAADTELDGLGELTAPAPATR